MATHIIDRLADMGADALANHYTIVLPSTIASLAIPNFDNSELAFRITNVDIPDKTIGTYAIEKRGLTFDRPSGKNETSREVTFTFRPDKRIITYNVLSAWMDAIQSNVTMSMVEDQGNNFRVDVAIYAISSLTGDNIFGNEIPNTIWTLNKCFPTSLGGISFDDTSGEPLSVSVTLNCFKIYYPDQVYTAGQL